MSRILTKHSLTHCGLLAVVLASLSFSSNLVGEQPNLNRPYAEWATDYDTAVEQSRRTGRPIMLSFTRSDRCDTCNKLSTEIYRSHEFARWSTRHVIKLEVDFPKTYSLPDRIRKQNEQLRKLFGHHVDKLPTVLFVTADGQLIGKTGYMDGGPEIWIEHAATIVRPRPSSDLVARSFYSVRK